MDESELLNRGLYKLQSGALEEAEHIFEDIIFTHKDPRAWPLIGVIKMRQGDLQQSIDAFQRGINAVPDMKEKYQHSYAELCLEKMEALKQEYLFVKKQGKEAQSRRNWGIILGGISAGIGNQKNASTFKAVAGVGGAAYGFNSAIKNSAQYKNSKEILAFLGQHIMQVIESVRQLCEDNQKEWLQFATGVDKMTENESNFRFIPFLIERSYQ
jgi:tetratricopeptide (TPR) repeat protein